MYCPNCGKEIADDSRFCRHCGTAQVASEPVASEMPAAPTAPSAASTVAIVETDSMRWVGWLVGGIVLLFTIIALASPDNGRSPDALAENIGESEVDAQMAIDALGNEVAKPTDAPKEIWSYSEDVDKVRGATSYYATTTSTNTIHQNSPYDSETSMTLTVRKSPAHGTDVLLTISSGQMMCPSYEGCSGTVSFDGGQPERISFNGPADHSSETIFVEGASSFIAKLKGSKKLVIEKTLYEAGNPQFEFDVQGLKWER